MTPFAAQQTCRRPTPEWQPSLAVQAAPAPATRWVDAEGNRLALRPLRATADAPLLGALWDGALLPQSRRNRFQGGRGRFTPLRLVEASTLAPPQGVALAITRLLPGGDEQMLAEGRWVRETTAGVTAEFALSVADGWQGHGLGRRLLLALVQTAQQQQVQALTAQVLQGNTAMQALLRRGGGRPEATGTHSDDGCLLFRCDPALLRQRLTQPQP